MLSACVYKLMVRNMGIKFLKKILEKGNNGLLTQIQSTTLKVLNMCFFKLQHAHEINFNFQ